MNKIYVSIIVPVYNREKYLNRCLNSLVNQTMKNIEIICIDDGSFDSSAKILKDYALQHTNIQVITQNNKGVAAARNIGINAARGEYIGFVDSDDWVQDNFFEKLYNAAKTENADIAAGGIIRLDKLHKKQFLKYNKRIISENLEERLTLCYYPNKSYVWNKIYKSSFLRDNNLIFEEGRIYEDIIFTPQALYFSDKCIFVHDTNYYYWRGKNTLVKRKDNKSQEDNCYAIAKADKFLKNKNIDITPLRFDLKKYGIGGMTIAKVMENKYFKRIYFLNIPIIKIKK